MIISEEELANRGHRDAAALLYGNCYSGVGITFLASSMLVFGFNSGEIQGFKHIWWMALFAMLILRVIDVFHWQTRLSQTAYDGKKVIRRYSLGVWVTATMWSLYSIIVFKHIGSTELTSMIIIISAMAGGGATILNAHKLTAIGYAFLLLVPLSCCLILSTETSHQLLGALGLGFCVVMIITSRKASLFTAQAIQTKNENAVLVNQMEEGIEQRTRQIYELSNLDPLTGLFNRTAFIKHLDNSLEESLESGSPLAVLFIDLDGFKRINDAIGHETGDRILTLTAARLKYYAPNERLLCRWGGDEFLMVFTDTEESLAVEKAQEVIHQISQAYVFDNNRLSLGATIGIAMFPEHAKSATELIRLADTAMYFQKKQSQSSTKVFSEHLGTELHREQFLRDGLADAIEKDQLSTVFQPLICSRSGQILAFEALLRWQYRNEAIPPDEFIRVAEQYGLIRKIGAWVLNEACRVASSWDESLGIVVCVNVSVNQLMDDDFIEIVDHTLQRYRLPGSALHIEITESVFASDKAIIFQRISALQTRGIEVSIDDFGTGYSSLSVMQDLGADIVKIDKSFVATLDSKGLAIISAVLQIAKSLKCRVVAEGVETKNQAQKLAHLGVDVQQGYYFSKPLKEDEVADYLQQAVTNPRQLTLVK